MAIKNPIRKFLSIFDASQEDVDAAASLLNDLKRLNDEERVTGAALYDLRRKLPEQDWLLTSDGSAVVRLGEYEAHVRPVVGKRTLPEPQKDQALIDRAAELVVADLRIRKDKRSAEKALRRIRRKLRFNRGYTSTAGTVVTSSMFPCRD